MRQPSTSAGAPVSLRVRGVDELVDPLRSARRRPRGRRATASPMPSASASLRVVACRRRTQRQGREWCGAGARHAASTSASSVGAGHGLGQERPDRPPRLDERRHACGLTGTGRPRAGGRARAPTPSRNHAGSRPRTIAAGTPRRLAHHELGRAGDLVGDRDLGHLELAARGRRAAPRRSTTAASPGDADGDVGEPERATPARTCRTR